MILYYAKIDRAILPRLGLALYLCCLLDYSVRFQHQKAPSDVEPSYTPIFRLIQSAVYPVGVSKFDYNSKNLIKDHRSTAGA